MLQRHHHGPWESVTLSERRSVELVTLGADVAGGRLDSVDTLAGSSEREAVLAWGKPMALDLVYSVIASPSPPVWPTHEPTCCSATHTDPISA